VPPPGDGTPSMAFAIAKQARHPLVHLAVRLLTTLARASHVLRTGQLLHPASTQGSLPTPEISLPGTRASPWTGLSPAGCHQLVDRLRHGKPPATAPDLLGALRRNALTSTNTPGGRPILRAVTRDFPNSANGETGSRHRHDPKRPRVDRWRRQTDREARRDRQSWRPGVTSSPDGDAVAGNMSSDAATARSSRYGDASPRPVSVKDAIRQ
jgi:hypothetical protein